MDLPTSGCSRAGVCEERTMPGSDLKDVISRSVQFQIPVFFPHSSVRSPCLPAGRGMTIRFGGVNGNRGKRFLIASFVGFRNDVFLWKREMRKCGNERIREWGNVSR